MSKVAGKLRLKELSENYLPHKVFRRDKECNLIEQYTHH